MHKDLDIRKTNDCAIGNVLGATYQGQYAPVVCLHYQSRGIHNHNEVTLNGSKPWQRYAKLQMS